MDVGFVIIMIAVMFILIGFIMKDYWICALGCFLLVGAGIYVITNGLNGEITWITSSVGFVIIGVGIYIGLKGGIENVNLD